MTTKQIDYCIELARTLNFSRAAENAFVSQPTFSYQVKLLEDEVGFTERHGINRSSNGQLLLTGSQLKKVKKKRRMKPNVSYAS